MWHFTLPHQSRRTEIPGVQQWTPASVLQCFCLNEADCTGHLKDGPQRHKWPSQVNHVSLSAPGDISSWAISLLLLARVFESQISATEGNSLTTDGQTSKSVRLSFILQINAPQWTFDWAALVFLTWCWWQCQSDPLSFIFVFSLHLPTFHVFIISFTPLSSFTGAHSHP